MKRYFSYVKYMYVLCILFNCFNNFDNCYYFDLVGGGIWCLERLRYKFKGECLR